MVKKCPEKDETSKKVKAIDIESMCSSSESSDEYFVMALKEGDKDCLHDRVATVTVEFLVNSKVVTQ